MRSSEEIRNLKIISINEGREISKVKDIIIDPAEGSLAFFIIEQPSDYFGARIIAFEDIVGLGDYALIIQDSEVIQDVAHSPSAIELLKKDVKIIGAQVLTTKGSRVGEVKEFWIDEETGKITVCHLLEQGEKRKKFKGENVVTYGKEIILIKEEPSLTAEPLAIENPGDFLKKKIEEFGKNDSLLEDGEKGEFINSPEFNVFEQKQLQFLLGKTVEKDIRLENGSILKAGEKISPEALAAIKSRQTLMQLTSLVVK